MILGMTKDIRKDPETVKSFMKKVLKLALLVPFVLTGCEDKKSVDTLGETEHYFDEKVTSISPGFAGTTWVGSETGRIWQVKGCSSEPFDVSSERIYKVLPEENNGGLSILWIGIRNSGLQKWSITDKGDLKKLKTYRIYLKENRYSPYDIIKVKDSIYTATTQGLFRLAEKDSLIPVFPQPDKLSKEYNNSFPVKNMCVCNDEYLWASSDHGALRFNLNNGQTDLFYPEIPVSHVSFRNDTLFILKENLLLRCKPDGTQLDSVSFQFNPKVYYQAGEIHYLIDRDNMLLSKNLQDFTMIPLRKKISDKCRNIILSDPENNYVLLLMEDALWRIPAHSGVFSDNDLIKIACNDDGKNYFLSSDNKLYLQKSSDIANTVYDFPKEEQIVWMGAMGDNIYYYNTEQEVKQLSISESLLKNRILHRPHTVYRSRHKITSAYIKENSTNPQLYLGIQDGLLLFDIKTGKVRKLSDFNDRYVTSFFEPSHSKLLYLSTLNSGIFYSSADTAFTAIEDTRSHTSVKDLIVTGSYPPQLISLTNHDIISHKSADSLLVRGTSKLLYINDSLFYAVSESGIRKILIDSDGVLKDGGNYYSDIRFNPAASFVVGTKLYLGSDLGVLMLDSADIQKMKWIVFKSDRIFGVKNLIFLCGSIALLIILYVYRHYKRRRSERRHLQKRINHLSECIEELQSYYDLADQNEQAEIQKLKNEIQRIDIHKQDRKRLHVTIKRLTDDIIQRNRDASLRLLKKLDDQIKTISGFETKEKSQLTEASYEVMKSNNIESIKNQVNVNERWITDFSFVEKELRILNENLAGIIEIDGLSKKMMQDLNMINEEFHQKPLSEMTNRYYLIRDQFDLLFTDEALVRILESADQMIFYLQKRKNEDIVSAALSGMIEEIKLQRDSMQRIKLLRDLELVNKRIGFLQIKDQMQDCIKAYTQLRDKIVDENDCLINKKYDKDLEHYIAGKTSEQVDKLEKLTVEAFRILQITDPEIINDILKISSYYHQQAKVLAILIAYPRVKRTLIPGMLGIYGNLNPVISRLINNKIKINEEILKSYSEQSPLNAVFVYYVLKLID